MIKRLFVLKFFLLATFAIASAQTVKVKKEKSTVKGEAMEGYSIELQGTLAEVSASFTKYLRTIGKVKQGDYLTITEPNFNGLAYSTPLFAISNGNGKTATAWLGINPSAWPEEDLDKVYKEIEKTVHAFGVKFYRDKIQVQIDESLRATQAVEKQQQRLLTENKSLSTKLENNKKEKIALEKSLENNKIEHDVLLKKLEQNKKSQDSIAVAAQQVKKVVEAHKEKQRNVK